LLLIIWL